MNRVDLQLLSRLRRREARVLLNTNLPAGAYYLAGYSVECALKACIARATKRHDFPDKNLALESYTHDLTRLLRAAGLEREFDVDIAASPALDRNWAIVKDWKETSRYDATIDLTKARQLYEAASARRSGVLAWLRQHW